MSSSPIEVEVATMPLLALNWMIAQAEGFTPRLKASPWFPFERELVDASNARTMLCGPWSPATGHQGGAIAEREHIGVQFQHDGPHLGLWMAQKKVLYAGKWVVAAEVCATRPLTAQMRCFILYKYGPKVHVPSDLMEAFGPVLPVEKRGL